jgi:hypothetical protein
MGGFNQNIGIGDSLLLVLPCRLLQIVVESRFPAVKRGAGVREGGDSGRGPCRYAGGILGRGRYPFGWYSYGAEGWKPGIARAAVGPLADVAPLETVNFPLSPGWYTFYLAVDDQINGQPDLTWVDSVEVEVE